ncbi:hypothetical protein [Candidatus Parabeggiatoa sp. HSG14]|uniref:hypothetical protein n=1 Tax=Candidatus Parabeggiatoa sp. HSG14 TaxID=3055593 RepID=UPI0025A7DCAB|nr:hypothetical protein [Thiotrichales bacterium HSG14]
MATRTIKTIDAVEHSGDSSRFTEYEEYIEYRSFLRTIIIYRSMIIHDSIAINFTEIFAIPILSVILGVLSAIITFVVIQEEARNEIEEVITSAVEVAEKSIAKGEKNNLQLNQEILAQEIEALFTQSYINPLTDYLLKYQGDNSRASYLKRIETERQKRCGKIGKRFQQQDKNSTTLVQLTRGYNYSCPQIVTGFAKSI